MITIDKPRNVSAEIPVALTKADKKRVKKVKLRTKPVTIPCGFLLLDPAPCLPAGRLPDNTIGRIGSIHGERIVIIPAKNANPIKNNIILY